jgi:ketosteroid isomerase-like protein
MCEVQKKEILDLIAEWKNALENRDANRLLLNYHSNVVFYDGIPPYKRVGVESVREMWLECLPCFPEKFCCEHRDFEVHVNGNMAFIHGLHLVIPLIDEEKWKSILPWMRLTICCEKDSADGKWLIVHEHWSIPFDPLTNVVAKFTP